MLSPGASCAGRKLSQYWPKLRSRVFLGGLSEGRDAAKLGVRYDSFEAVASTEFDARGHMIADAPSSAFRKVTINVHVRSDAPADQLREVERLALAGCPGINTLRARVPVESELKVTRTSAERAA